MKRKEAEVMIQAWAFEQGEKSKRVFDSQDTMVPWKLNKRFVSDEERAIMRGGLDEEKGSSSTSNSSDSSNRSSSGSSGSEATPEGACKHMTEDLAGDFVFQRYCHVYKEGELETL